MEFLKYSGTVVTGTVPSEYGGGSGYVVMLPQTRALYADSVTVSLTDTINATISYYLNGKEVVTNTDDGQKIVFNSILIAGTTGIQIDYEIVINGQWLPKTF